jgi:excisionase family DNA binding protein
MYEDFEHEILTVEELMELLYIGKNTAYQLLKSGEIRAFRIGRVWKIPKEAVSEYIVRMAGERSENERNPLQY